MVGVSKRNRLREEHVGQCSRGKKPSFCSPTPCLPRPAEPSFFKIMIGDFREVLFIPPKFANALVGLVNQNVYLEDFHGNSSRVKVSVVDNSLAFEEGWHDFVLDHSIGFGEVLVFKYVSKSLFSVQIFGINACEKVSFGKRNSNNFSIKNRNKADLSPERSQLPKRHKIFEASKDEYCAAKKDSKKKDDPSDSGDRVVKCVLEDGNKPENTPQHYCDSGSPQIVDVMDVTGSPVSMINGQATEEPEEKGSSPVDEPNTYFVQETSLHKKERLETGFHPYHVARFSLVEDHEDSHGKSQTTQTVACTISETKNQMACCWDIIPYTPKIDSSQPSNTTKKGLVREQGKHKIQNVGLRTSRPLEVTVTNLIAAEEIVCKFLLTEEGICHIVDGDLANGLGAVRVIPVSLSASEIGTSLSCNDNVNMFKDASCQHESVPGVNCLGPEVDYLGAVRVTLVSLSAGEIGTSLSCNDNVNMFKDASCQHESVPGVNCLGPKVDYVGAVRVTHVSLSASEIGTSLSCNDNVNMSKDASSQHESVPGGNCLGPKVDYVSKENGNSPGSLSRKDFSPLVGRVGGTLHDIPDLETTEEYPCQSGTAPDVLPEEDKKENTPCLRSQDLKAVKVEPIDLKPRSSSSFCFSLTLPSNTQCWLELPQGLPSYQGKKRRERKVINLRDPSLRLWPVLYVEGINFIGLMSGWKDFAIANNLQQGNLCRFFEVANKLEPTFQVQITRPLNSF